MVNRIKKPKISSLELAYETGFHIGDGTMTFRKNKNEYCVTYYGNNITEREFYEKVIVP